MFLALCMQYHEAFNPLALQYNNHLHKMSNDFSRIYAMS